MDAQQQRQDMPIHFEAPQLKELKPRIVVCGVGGAGGNAVNNMVVSGLSGVDFMVANTDAQTLASSRAERIIQMGLQVTEGLGAGARPEVGKAAAEEALEEICDHLAGSHMVFLTAGMGGGTGTGAAPVIARAAREMGILTVGVVTKPFHFESGRRMRVAEAGVAEMKQAVDTLIVIPNQNLFRLASERTTFVEAFAMADQVLCSGVACITNLMVKEGLVNLDFADVCSIMYEMGTAMIGSGEATGEGRVLHAAEARSPIRCSTRPRCEALAACSSPSPGAAISRSTNWMRPRAGSVRRSTTKPTSSWARPLTTLLATPSGCLSSRRASIALLRTSFLSRSRANDAKPMSRTLKKICSRRAIRRCSRGLASLCPRGGRTGERQVGADPHLSRIRPIAQRLAA